MAGWECPPLFVYGGLGVFGDNLARALVELGHEVTWIGCLPAGQEPRVHRGAYTSVPLCSFRDLSERDVWGIWHSLVSSARGILHDADLVVLHDHHVAPLSWVAREGGARLVYYDHSFAGNPEEVAGLMMSDAVAVNSELSRGIVSYAVETFLRGVEPPPRRPPVHVVYPAAPRHLPPADPGLVETIKRWRSGGLVLAVGRNQEHKNMGAVERAVGVLRSRGVEAWAIIAGNGWSDEDRGAVKIMGWVEPGMLSALYEAADVFVLPSLYEPFGMVALEAALRGKPVVLSERSGVREVLPEAPVFDPRSPEDLAVKLEALLRSPDEAAELGEKLRRRAEARSWGDVAREILGLVERDA